MAAVVTWQTTLDLQGEFHVNYLPQIVLLFSSGNLVHLIFSLTLYDRQ